MAERRGARRSARDSTFALLRTTRQGWAPSRREFVRWLRAALGQRARHCEVCVLLVGPARSRSLNRDYRGKDQATNVLSFPAAPLVGRSPSIRGDLVICPQVLRIEARAQRKSARAHWAHLFVHGLLHLDGYDHERDDDARRMEQRERRVLRTLRVADPYLLRADGQT